MEKYDNLEPLRKLYGYRSEEVNVNEDGLITVAVIILAILYFGFGILKAVCPFLQ